MATRSAPKSRLTDDQRRELYLNEGHNWTHEEQTAVFGRRPWTWARESGHSNRNYRDFFDTPLKEDNDADDVFRNKEDTILFNLNTQNGENILNYRIKIAARRRSRLEGAPLPNHPEPGPLKLISLKTKEEKVIEVLANKRVQNQRNLKRVSGTLTFAG